MRRNFLAIILALLIAMTGTLPVFGDTLPAPETYQITVSQKGGAFDFNGISVEFKKDFLGKDTNPVTFDVSIYAENGLPYIEFSPSTDKFAKQVTIKVEKENRNFYDTITGETCSIYLTRYNFKVKHFSRFVVID